MEKLAEFHAIGSALLFSGNNNNNNNNSNNNEHNNKKKDDGSSSNNKTNSKRNIGKNKNNNSNSSSKKESSSSKKENSCSGSKYKNLKQELEDFRETKCDTEIIYETLSPFFKVGTITKSNTVLFSYRRPLSRQSNGGLRVLKYGMPFSSSKGPRPVKTL